jgi:hypothetical protein
MPVTTTLNRIRSSLFWTDGWKKLLHSLDKTKSDDEPLPLVAILDSNGIDDALLCLSVVEGHDKEIRLFAVECVREVQHLMKDSRSLDALDVAERYAHGDATDEELRLAQDAAHDAYYASAACTAYYAAARVAAPAADVAWQAYYAASDAAHAYAGANAARAAPLSDPLYVGAQAHEAASEKQAEIFRRIFGETLH